MSGGTSGPGGQLVLPHRRQGPHRGRPSPPSRYRAVFELSLILEHGGCHSVSSDLPPQVVGYTPDHQGRAFSRPNQCSPCRPIYGENQCPELLLSLVYSPQPLPLGTSLPPSLSPPEHIQGPATVIHQHQQAAGSTKVSVTRYTHVRHCSSPRCHLAAGTPPRRADFFFLDEVREQTTEN